MAESTADRYRALYESSQKSLTNMAALHTQSLIKLANFKQGLINIIRQNFPTAFAEAERLSGKHLIEYEDEILLAYIGTFLELANSEQELPTPKPTNTNSNTPHKKQEQKAHKKEPKRQDQPDFSTLFSTQKNTSEMPYEVKTDATVTQGQREEGGVGNQPEKKWGLPNLTNLIYTQNTELETEFAPEGDDEEEDFTFDPTPPASSWGRSKRQTSEPGIDDTLERRGRTGLPISNDDTLDDDMDDYDLDEDDDMDDYDLGEDDDSIDNDLDDALDEDYSFVPPAIVDRATQLGPQIRPEYIPQPNKSTQTKKITAREESLKTVRTVGTPPTPISKHPQDYQQPLVDVILSPKPVFIRDLKLLFPEPGFIDGWVAEVNSAKNVEYSFIEPPPEYKDRGALVIPHKYLSGAPREYKRTIWAQVVDGYRGNELYQAAVFIASASQTLVSVKVTDSIAIFHENSQKGTVAFIVLVDTVVDGKLSLAVKSTLRDRLSGVIILVANEPALSAACSKLEVAAEKNNWTVNFPISAAVLSKYIDDKKSIPILNG